MSVTHPGRQARLCYPAAMLLAEVAGWFGDVSDLIRRGGVVMWPLLGLSVLSLTLSIERLVFFARTNGAAGRRKAAAMAGHLRAGRRAEAAALAEGDGSVYSTAVREVMGEPGGVPGGVPGVDDAVEAARRRVERFLPTLSTVITAAPMLGILGTVLGIIDSFAILGEAAGSRDPALVGRGIGEALITTAAGLVVTLVTLVPYAVLRVQAQRTLARVETLATRAASGRGD
ncbi:MAG: MotA/TolQ/ExbB proton channel family protein [Planctomycetota bacterium]